MPAATLYLTGDATASPFPTTSRLLSQTPKFAQVTLGPVEFDQNGPGTSDAGQWNPSSPIADTTLAAEIDNTGASLGTTRQGWLWDQDLTGMTLAAAAWTVRLRIAANQGTGTAARVLMRVTVVTGSGGVYTTVANLLTTQITGEGSHSTGQEGWRDNGSRITVVTAPTNFALTFAGAATSLAHTFQSGERLLIEFGFCDADSATDRTWRLDFNTRNSLVITPDLTDDRVMVTGGSPNLPILGGTDILIG